MLKTGTASLSAIHHGTLKKPGSECGRMQKKGSIIRKIPSAIEQIIFDFDGVFTNNSVIVDENGKESVICNRSDGLGISILHDLKIPLMILSTEKNSVVAHRAKKLKIPLKQGLQKKEEELADIITSGKLNPANIIFVGNDVNDLECMEIAGVSVCPSDAHPAVLKRATIVLSHSGGNGAVREFVDYILEKYHSGDVN
jgi:YrbI family 3-deoxy-D-manno-octulosonate 8-phosphate phosphatase